jgi:hypothetical protein
VVVLVVVVESVVVAEGLEGGADVVSVLPPQAANEATSAIVAAASPSFSIFNVIKLNRLLTVPNTIVFDNAQLVIKAIISLAKTKRSQ